MEQIFPGLYVITRGATNSYLIESAPDELTLIDTGTPGTTNAILQAAAALNYQPEQIKQILITHADIDHVGSLAPLVAATGATVYAGKASVPYIESASTPPHVPAFMKLMNVFIKPVSVDVTFNDLEVLPIADGILAIHVPGHTPENYNFFWEKHGVLFAADVFFTFGRVTLSPSLIAWDKNKLRQSAMSALNLAPKYICAGHGTPVNLIKHPEKIARLRLSLEGGTTLAAI